MTGIFLTGAIFLAIPPWYRDSADADVSSDHSTANQGVVGLLNVASSKLTSMTSCDWFCRSGSGSPSRQVSAQVPLRCAERQQARAAYAFSGASRSSPLQATRVEDIINREEQSDIILASSRIRRLHRHRRPEVLP